MTLLAILSVLTIFYSCDSLEDDVRPQAPTFELVNDEFHVLTDGKGYIDLYSIVKTQSKIKLNVSSQPTNGNLWEVGPGLLKYVPLKNYKGRDAFLFSIYNTDNKLLKTDTIDLVVDEDTSNLPCIYPQDDWIYSAGSPITVDVLANDVVCDDSSDLVVEIYRPNNNFPPHSGTAIVTAGKQISYSTATTGNNVRDSVIYKLYKASNPGVFGFATLAIDINGGSNSCTPVIRDDSYYLQMGNPSADTLNLYVLLNDDVCEGISDITVTGLPHHSTIAVNSDHIRYPYELSESTPTITDSLTYKVCVDQQCYTSKVRIKIF